MKCDPQTAERIGLPWLRTALAPIGDFGRRAEDAARTFAPGDEVAAIAQCARIAELAQLLAPDGVGQLRSLLRRVPDPLEIVARATVGDSLGDVDFFELARFADALDATARAWDTAGGKSAERPPVIPEIAALLAPGRIGGGFYLADAFAPSLAAARVDLAAADAALTRQRARLHATVADLIGMVPDGDEFIVMRDAMPQLPAGLRVVRETPAYRLLALELDAGTLAATVERDMQLAHTAEQEDRVRRDLATAIARSGAELLAAARALGELDRTLARVVFTQSWGGCVPELTRLRFAFTSATYVPLRAALAAAALPYTPISLDLRGVAILTGPNMGGKSAALATCGFLAACVANGVPPPAEAAALPLLATVVWIGGERDGDRARLLSAFGGEVVRTREALAGAGDPALMLVDEFARTTGPREGRALLVAFVEALARSGAFAVVATHFDDVARDAAVRDLRIAGLAGSLDAHAAHDFHAALDAVAQAMDYRIIEADAQPQIHSDALALAGLLGLDAAIVERAQALFATAAAGPPDRIPE